jgi:hypothetical protein
MKKLSVWMVLILGLGIWFAMQSFAQEQVRPPERTDEGDPRAAEFGPPKATIQNELARADLWLPDPVGGYYRGTRFDWSGTISNFCYKGSEWFSPWFVKSDPTVEDMKYDPALRGWVAGINSANWGPVNEFSATDATLPPGYKEAPVGGTFLKIGVGMLRKPNETKYNHFKSYEIVNGGKWTANFKKESDRIEFIQRLDDPSGYGYVYTKTVSLTKGKPELVVEHSLKNTGSKLIDTDVCNNTFLNESNSPTSGEWHFNFRFKVDTAIDKAKANWIYVDGSEINFAKEFQGDDKLDLKVQGFNDETKAMQAKSGAARSGMGFTWDQPLSGVELSAIRSVMNLKKFFKVRVEPGSEFKWRVAYSSGYIMMQSEKNPKGPASARPAPAAKEPAAH